MNKTPLLYGPLFYDEIRILKDYAHADHWLREKYDIHKWTARSKDDVIELENYLKQRLGID